MILGVVREVLEAWGERAERERESRFIALLSLITPLAPPPFFLRERPPAKGGGRGGKYLHDERASFRHGHST